MVTIKTFKSCYYLKIIEHIVQALARNKKKNQQKIFSIVYKLITFWA